jgi:hypothetical protein
MREARLLRSFPASIHAKNNGKTGAFYATMYTNEEEEMLMIYSHEVDNMCRVIKGADHGPAPIPQEGKWTQVREIKDIQGFTHGIGWCAPQQGACKLTLNVKDGRSEERRVGKYC